MGQFSVEKPVLPGSTLSGNQQSEELYHKALALSAEVEDNFLELGRALRRLQEHDTQLFQQAVAKSKLGRRKAYYLVEVSRTFEKLPIPRARLRRLGWTKLQVIAGSVDADNVEELVALAEGNTAKQLQRIMRGEEPLKDSNCVLLYFAPEQYAKFRYALLQNGAKASGRGLIGKEEALIKALRKAEPGLGKVHPAGKGGGSAESKKSD